ncbi:MAG: hypothetical protein A3D24_04120 [Candidatus Blackburnbacteria bacterium RIFCSPHIGHO2_02_FULL_39_13]|uniref:Uncharacterized protein n=1 Tax=Candidatus Blackburnbacteria bacterium RIFCSPLOWO2_01_FULL_40_20 TaxID=1797519 RepID=A0A1G1VB33_9BACT|nr:MAG: hypothetical protein A2694_02695 [Candidatus Blackburnbacteria bacterium RIFCSPHIGHO2_01_FULL_40_17]OGY08417.1 MAG: hypothetical protein A3D24_04120 [Candidatus Blackburnbacteria bacterium RIFCSPHIGHO2_02_FULL_39_13]OGY12487.1 MAG: hypothetical protein A3A77_00740 [Candidatus Blackburnbacteria bacterium RIFCSPLOWO2_01_FULL_40_20]HBL52131.1 hypothetical protein [Candidatus Blackburnbacteria bacterium]
MESQLPQQVPEKKVATPLGPKLIYIIVGVVFLLILAAIGVAYKKDLLQSIALKKDNKVSQQPVTSPSPSIAPFLSPSSPLFAIEKSTIKRVMVSYQLQGNIKSISPTNNNEGFELEMYSPVGQDLGRKFFLPKSSKDLVVKVDSQGKQSEFTASEIKAGDQILMDYSFDMSKPEEGKITRLAIVEK